MDKLIQTIQDEINNLMNSRWAKLTDNKLESIEKRTVASKDVIEKIIEEYYSSKRSVKEICVDYGVTYGTFKRQKISYGLEVHRRSDNLKLQKVLEKKNHIDEKMNDIKSGMKNLDYQNKWNVSQSAYYQLKRKLKKDLVD
jgi:hypothetical protein